MVAGLGSVRAAEGTETGPPVAETSWPRIGWSDAGFTLAISRQTLSATHGVNPYFAGRFAPYYGPDGNRLKSSGSASDVHPASLYTPSSR